MLYDIIRFYQDGRKQKVVKKGVTLEEAKEHCQREDTREAGKWFDGFREAK